MARYQIILAYDGTNFLGFQRQGRGRSVQGEVENALREIGWQGRAILAAGRTDTGVHAAGQVIAFDFEWKHQTEDLQRALNANLPPDVAVQRVMLATEDFHPRFSARGRTYEYHLFSAPHRHPLREHYAWRIYPPLELNTLKEAANLLVGTHDFAAFGSPPRPGGSTIREVFRAEWQALGDALRFEVTANAFLYRMVRRMVYLQTLVGAGQLSLKELGGGIADQTPLTPGLAPAQGLVLKEVLYEE
jgi:tRNA pseudouridine38-40 synthase